MKYDLKELYFSFNGRFPRLDYFLYGIVTISLFNKILFFILSTIEDILFGQPVLFMWISPISVFLSLLTLWPALALTTKRFHDLNRSMAWAIILEIILFFASSLMDIIDYFEDQEGAYILVSFLFILLFPFLIAGIAGIIHSFFIKGTKGPNKYGLDPLEAAHD